MLQLLVETAKQYKTPLIVVGIAIAASTFIYVRSRRLQRVHLASANELLLSIVKNSRISKYNQVHSVVRDLPSLESVVSPDSKLDSKTKSTSENDHTNPTRGESDIFSPIYISSNNYLRDARLESASELLAGIHADEIGREDYDRSKPLQMRDKSVIRALFALNEYTRALESLRAIAFDRENESHVSALEVCWSKIAPGVLLNEANAVSSDDSSDKLSSYKRRIVSPKWEEWAGFQGPDPATDVRGGGELAIRVLKSFVSTYPDAARSICEKYKENGIGWFGMSIASINVTARVLKLVSERKLDRYLVVRANEIARSQGDNSLSWVFTESIFHELHAGVLFQLHRTWVKERPPNVMSFGQVFERVLNKFLSSVEAGTFKPPQPNEGI